MTTVVEQYSSEFNNLWNIVTKFIPVTVIDSYPRLSLTKALAAEFLRNVLLNYPLITTVFTRPEFEMRYGPILLLYVPDENIYVELFVQEPRVPISERDVIIGYYVWKTEKEPETIESFAVELSSKEAEQDLREFLKNRSEYLTEKKEEIVLNRLLKPVAEKALELLPLIPP